MIEALCKGKLNREVEGMEDMLTSAVFGRLRYLPLGEGLMPFLNRSRYPDGSAVLPEGLTVVEARYTFWPRWIYGDSAGAEPDVVIELLTNAGKYIVLVEAKFQSFKSSEAEPELAAPADQLAREWDNLVGRCIEEACTPLMVYLTADFAIPKSEIEKSAMEFASKRPASAYPFKCGWLSWRHLRSALANSSSLVASDIDRLLKRHELTFFEGIDRITRCDWHWRFTSPLKFDFFNVAPVAWSWRFANGK